MRSVPRKHPKPAPMDSGPISILPLDGTSVGAEALRSTLKTVLWTGAGKATGLGKARMRAAIFRFWIGSRIGAVIFGTRLRGAEATPVRSGTQPVWRMYAGASNFFAVEAPVMVRTMPKIGRSNQGRSCLPAIAQAIPA